MRTTLVAIALLASTVAAAGSSLAIVEKVDEATMLVVAAADDPSTAAGNTAVFVGESYYEAMTAASDTAPCKDAESCILDATVLAQAAVGNAVLLKQSAEAMAIGAVNGAAQDPTGAPDAELALAQVIAGETLAAAEASGCAAGGQVQDVPVGATAQAGPYGLGIGAELQTGAPCL